MRLRLEDQGDGWFWESTAIEVAVVSQTWSHSRRYYQVRLEPPLERQESGACTPSGLILAVYSTAWLSPRWVGHEINRESDMSAFLWLTGEETEATPPSDSPPSARVMCREVS